MKKSLLTTILCLSFCFTLASLQGCKSDNNSSDTTSQSGTESESDDIFTVTFDGENAETYSLGDKILKPQDPTKENTAEYTYTFDGWYNGETKWDFENDTVSGNVNLVAKFTETKNTYTVTFNGDHATTLEYGAKVSEPTAPVKPSTVDKTYTFDGWYNGETKWNFATDTVSGNVDLVAKFTESTRTYTVTFNGDHAKTIEYGAKVSEPTAPVKPATAEYTYTFSGWYNGETKWNFATDTVDGDVDLIAKFTETKNEYSVTFNGGNATTLEYGAKVTEPTAPTKEATAEYTYTFDGWYNGETKWNFATDTVSGNVNLVSKFTSTKNKYTITFNGGNATTLEYGSKVSEPTAPVKPSTVDKVYKFDGWYNGETKWNFATDTVSGNVDLVAKFTESTRTYTVTFNGENAKTIEYGAKVTEPTAPVKPATVDKVYKFDGWYNGETKWNFATDTVGGDVNLVAKFTESARTYTVKFNGGNETTLEYGAKITEPTAPTKEATAEYTYTFDGWYNGETKWNFATDTVSGNVNLVSKFTSTKNKYSVTIDGENKGEFEYGTKLTKPADLSKTNDNIYYYVFDGWYNGETKWNFENDTVTGTLVLTHKFNNIAIADTIKADKLTVRGGAATTDGDATKVAFDGSEAGWGKISFKTLTVEKELHVFVKNDSEYVRLVQLNWTSASVVLDETGKDVTSSIVKPAGTLIPANSGWYELIYVNASETENLSFGEFNLHSEGGATACVGNLYIKNLSVETRVSYAKKVIEKALALNLTNEISRNDYDTVMAANAQVEYLTDEVAQTLDLDKLQTMVTTLSAFNANCNAMDITKYNASKGNEMFYSTKEVMNGESYSVRFSGQTTTDTTKYLLNTPIANAYQIKIWLKNTSDADIAFWPCTTEEEGNEWLTATNHGVTFKNTEGWVVLTYEVTGKTVDKFLFTYGPWAAGTLEAYIGKIEVIDDTYYVNQIRNSYAQVSEYAESDTPTLAQVYAMKEFVNVYNNASENAKNTLTESEKQSISALATKVNGVSLVSELQGGNGLSFTSTNSWEGHYANMANKTDTSILFSVTGVDSSVGGAVYITLFYTDNAANMNASDNGLMHYIHSGGMSSGFSFVSGKSMAADKTYFVKFDIKVAEDYSSVTVSVKIEDETGDVVMNGNKTVTSIKDSTVAEWVQDEHNNYFYINTGATKGMTVA